MVFILMTITFIYFAVQILAYTYLPHLRCLEHEVLCFDTCHSDHILWLNFAIADVHIFLLCGCQTDSSSL